jgi:IS30 family transposase
MSTQKLIPIDGEKLKIEILKKGLSFKQIDEEVGFAHGYVSRTTKRNSITRGFIKMLEKMYDIPFSDYEPEKSKQQEDQPAVDAETIKPETHIIHDIINLSELKHVIYEAVYQAVLDAWQDDEPRTDTENDKGLINGVPYV